MEKTIAETIHYAFGKSSLGEFIAARSGQGLVVFEFSDNHDQSLERLRRLVPDAVLEEDRTGMGDWLAALSAIVDHPERECPVPLDMRGTDFQKRVWEVLRRIPAGETTYYGAVAAELGSRDARDATEAIANNPIAILIPCHRVIKKTGALSGYAGGVWRKRALLKREQQASGFKLSG
jgi:AraC family transcriptional regulator, regulatory protein of adaptative response / methylated-DNA-[protein]-cysteine methyltransferase